ncbi:TetR/AcrR family transcriptional regulator [Sorangium sp. So ce1024]|uniref:TetR/AcrR family transcriptional regulator n=1 Tax=Sorangium sp. So ce1024 TaxID=3133327 RepID=UPI003F0FAF6E
MGARRAKAAAPARPRAKAAAPAQPRAKAAAPARRARRHDPGRRERLVATALEVIAEHGVAGASHRSIARAADVPLGSTTYHFASIDELLAAAFTRHADTVAARFEERMRAACDREAAVDCLVEHLSSDLLGSSRDLVLSVELYVAAARRPALRAVTQAWMQRSRRALELHFDPVTARELDALIEGLVLHSALSTDPMNAEQIRHAIRRFTA